MVLIRLRLVLWTARYLVTRWAGPECGLMNIGGYTPLPAREDPEGFIDTPGPITIDEAQRCPDILNAIKRSVDRDRRPGRFLLAGSANFALIKGISETLAGRAVYFTMHPLTLRETRGNIKEKPFLPRSLRRRSCLPRRNLFP